MRIFTFLYIVTFLSSVFSDNNFLYDKPRANATDMKDMLGLTTGGPYTYSQSGHHFYGTGYDGTYIDTYGCCSGQSGSCRNNPSCQCQVAVGPLPQGTYSLGNIVERSVGINDEWSMISKDQQLVWQDKQFIYRRMILK